jgi:hypothetical protein
MYFKVNPNGKIKVPKLSLRLSGGSGLGILQLGDNLPDCELNANDVSIIKFTIYEKLDGKKVQYYDQIETGKLIETDSIGVYRITDVAENRTGKVAYKEVTVKSLEDELRQRMIFDISGVFSLYNIADTDYSLMHVICNSLGNWKIGSVDSSLTSLYRTFDIDSCDAYSLMKDKISTSFKCIFQFDTYNRKINVVSIDNFGEKVDILLSYRNLVKQNLITDSLNNVFTVFRVKGGNDLSIRDVNPTLSDKIINLDYFMVKKSEGGNATDGLVDAWNAYKILSESLTTTQNANISQLNVYQNELLALNNTTPSTVTTDWTQYGLTELNTQKTSYTVLQSTLLSKGAGSPTDSQYSEYQSVTSTINAIQAQIVIRTNQIAAKQAQIDALNTTISNIANQLSYSNNFTEEQIQELYSFFRESDYVDETYVVANTDSETTKLEIQQQLYNVSSEELARVSQPQYEIDTTMNNLFCLPEFSGYREGFKLGNIITIRFSDTLIATARLLSIKINFNKLDDISVVFANRNKLDSNTIDLKKILAQASSTSNTVSVSGIAWDKAASKTNEISKYMSSSLNAAVQEIKNSDDEEVTYGKYGIRLKSKNEVTGIYDGEETWITKNKLLFSTDNFNSAIAGIGKFVGSDGNTYYGFMGEAIVSKINITSALSIINESNTITLNKNGATFTNCDITINKGVNTLKLNATDGIRLTKNGVSQFYIDGSGNATFGGILNAASGSFSGSVTSYSGIIGGWSIGSSSLSSPTSRMSLSGSGLNLFNSVGNYLGGIAATASTDGGVVIVKSDAANYLAFATTTATNPYDGMSVSLDLLYTPNAMTIGSTFYESGFHFRLTDVYIDFGGLKATSNIETNNTLKAGIEVNAPTGSFQSLYLGNPYNPSTPRTLFNPSDYALSGHTHYSNNLNAVYGGGAIWIGSVQAAGYEYVNYTFEKIGSSDFRLKKNIQPLDIPKELFMKIKTKQFEYKTSSFKKGKCFGVLSQELESLFKEYNLNPDDYSLFEKIVPRENTDEGMYVDDYIHKINYENFISLLISVVQTQQNDIDILKEQVGITV